MFPLQILAIFSTPFLIYAVVPWQLFLNLDRICYDLPNIPFVNHTCEHGQRSCGDSGLNLKFPFENHTCEHSQQSCGDSGLNLKYPFRFEDDPSFCSYPQLNLSCWHNRTVLYSNNFPEEFYYVQSINYENRTIRVIDPGVQKDNCSTLPLFSLHINHGFSGYLEQNRINQQSRWLYLSISDNIHQLVFVSCKNLVRSKSKLKFHRILDTASCNFSAAHFANHNNAYQVSDKTNHHSSSYNYVLVGRDLSVSDIEELCTINRVFPAQIDESLLNDTGHDVSFLDIHNLLADGFQLQYGIIILMQGLVTQNKPFLCYLLSILTAFDGISRIWPYLDIALRAISVARTTIGILLLMAFLIYKWRGRHLSMYDSIEEFLQANNGLMPIRYPYREIKSMTNNFGEKLGE